MSTAWQWRCGACGHTSPARGVFRIGTSGTARTIGRCSRCGRWRMLVLERAGPGPAIAAGEIESDRTWMELTAYVSEGSMTVEVAERIARSRAAEGRKRVVAAQVASGALSPEDAARLLEIPGAKTG